MTEPVIECVTFALADGYSREDFLKASEGISRFASAQPGFLSRTLLEAEDGSFIDWVKWETMEAAKAAAAAIGSSQDCKAAMPMIAGETVVMRHAVERQSA